MTPTPQFSTREKETAWVVRFRPNPSARLRLFCIPYAGVGASVYFPWTARIHPSVELVAIQFPGREGRIREEPIDRLSRLAPEAARCLLPYLDRPYALFGHSMGALVGYEVARCLADQKVTGPVHLFVSGRRAPGRRDVLPPIHNLPDRDFVEEVSRRWNGIPQELLREKDLLDLLLPTLRADVAVIETYDHVEGEPLACPISVFGGTEDGTTGPEDLQSWRRHTRGAFKLSMMPGNHFFIRSQQNAILDSVVADLLPALAGGGGGTC